MDGDATPLDRSPPAAASGGALLPWVAAAIYLGFLGSFAIGWFLPPSLVGIGDWDWVFSDAWLSVSGLLERGWPALWSIQLAGGAPLAADPESLSHSPFLLLPLAFGPIVGTKLLLTSLIATGLVGCHRLGQRWIGDDVGATAFAFAFVFSGYFAIHFRAGHMPWAAFYLVPWVLLYADRLLFDPAATLAASIGFLASLVGLFSGLVYHALVYFLLPVAVVYAILNVRRARPHRVRYVLSLAVGAMTLTTIRWLAILDWEQMSPRNVVGVGGMPWVAMGKMLVTSIEDYKDPVTWGGSGVWEYWSYVGAVTSTLALASLGARGRWRTFGFACLVIGGLLAWRGPWGSPLEWIAPRVPFLSSVRVYTRFLDLVVFAVALLAGGAIGELHRRMSGKLAWLPLLLLLAMVGDYWRVVRPIWSKVFALPVEQAYPDWGVTVSGPRYGVTLSAPPFQEFTSNQEMFNSRMLPLLMAGAVVDNAYITMALPWARPPEGKVVEGLPEGAYRLRNHEIDISGNFHPGQQIPVHLHYKKSFWRVANRESARVEPDVAGMKVVILAPCQNVRVLFRDGREILGWIISAIAVASTFAVLRRGP
jgi:hypothetical protein